jgi:hypothetical protein
MIWCFQVGRYEEDKILIAFEESGPRAEKYMREGFFTRATEARP